MSNFLLNKAVLKIPFNAMASSKLMKYDVRFKCKVLDFLTYGVKVNCKNLSGMFCVKKSIYTSVYTMCSQLKYSVRCFIINI